MMAGLPFMGSDYSLALFRYSHGRWVLQLGWLFP
jgi:hypothetical protein